MMKNAIQKTVVGMVAMGQFGCGIVQDAVTPREKRTQEIRFENRSSADLMVYTFMSEWSSENECEPNYKDERWRVFSQTAIDTYSEVECRHEPKRSVRVEMIRDYNVGVIGIWKAESAAKLRPGFELIVRDESGGLWIPIRIVEQAPVNPDHPNPWLFPIQESAPVAWVSKHELNGETFWRLQLAIPKHIDADSLFVGFPQSSGIDQFGNYQVRLQDGYYVSRFRSFGGEPIWISMNTERIKIVCDDAGCVSQDF
jgi:hypothetical protein